ncbi:MAG: ATP-binding protein [Rhodoglobus sp.]
MSEYTKRIIDDAIDELFPSFAAISIEGARAIGKTSTGRQRAATILDLDLPEVRELVQADPQFIATQAAPVLIDEWQHVPEVWDRVRRLVDGDPAGGQFILAGSAAPVGANIHSGAGRIIRFRMRPLSVAERGIAPATVSLRELFAVADSTTLAVIQGESPVELREYVREILSSGFPQARAMSDRARGVWLADYIERVITHDFAEQGYRVRRPELLRGWLRGYAAATASSTSFTKLGASLDPGEPAGSVGPTRATSLAYRDVLNSLYLLDQVDAWEPGQQLSSKPAKAPKHFLADPALAARLLNLNEAKLLSATAPATNNRDRTLLGDFFEGLVALSLHTYAQANDAQISHFRDRDGRHEIDFIIHRGHAEAIGVEVKLKASITDHDVRHLLWLKESLPDQITDLVIITTGSRAYRRQDGVAVVPLALLTA